VTALKRSRPPAEANGASLLLLFLVVRQHDKYALDDKLAFAKVPESWYCFK
jgi:hypothetical protein